MTETATVKITPDNPNKEPDVDEDVFLHMRARLREAFTSGGRVINRRSLYRVSLAGHEPTGATIHHRGGEVLEKPASLVVAQLEGDEGYYLFYLDDNDEVLTDTYHSRIEGAFHQATFEFGVAKEDWERLKPDSTDGPTA